MKNMVLLVAVLAAVAALGSGCSTVGLGKKDYSPVTGELTSTQGVNLDKAYEATLAAMSDLSYSVTEKYRTGSDGKVIARAPGDTKVEVKLEKKSDTATEFAIQVGTLGDEMASRKVMVQIKSHL